MMTIEELTKENINIKTINMLYSVYGLDVVTNKVKMLLYGHRKKIPKFLFITYTQNGYIIKTKNSLTKRKKAPRKKIKSGLISYLKRIKTTMSDKDFESLCLTKGVSLDKLNI